MSIIKNSYVGNLNGIEASIFTLANSKGMEVRITDLGGTILSMKVSDRNGKFEDVALGYGRLEQLLERGPYFGAIIGRFANRIEKGSFEIDGKEYKVAANQGKHHLHGGLKGFDKVLWNSKASSEGNRDILEFSYLSKDGEEGYPGNLRVKVTYILTEDNALEMHYHAVTDKDTVINLTNHAYFNLSGHASGDVLDHYIMINADKFTVNDEDSIPTGEIREVKGTPMDFTKPVKIGQVINNDYEQLIFGNGFDHNWILKVNGKAPEKAAEAYDEKSGRVLEVFTTKPGIQFYSGNYLDEAGIGKDNTKYEKNSGLCLETQYYPNSTTHKHFPSPILRVGEEYNHITIYKFSVR